MFLFLAVVIRYRHKYKWRESSRLLCINVEEISMIHKSETDKKKKILLSHFFTKNRSANFHRLTNLWSLDHYYSRRKVNKSDNFFKKWPIFKLWRTLASLYIHELSLSRRQTEHLFISQYLSLWFEKVFPCFKPTLRLKLFFNTHSTKLYLKYFLFPSELNHQNTNPYW